MLTYLVLILIFGTLVALYYWYRAKTHKNHYANLLQEIKKKQKVATTYQLDLTTIVIKQRTWKKDIMVDILGTDMNSSYRVSNAHYEFKKVHKYESKLTIPIIYNGEHIKLLTTLNLDGHWLGIKFHLQKFTNLYIDKNDVDNSFIDLCFLEKEGIDYVPIHTLDFILER